MATYAANLIFSGVVSDQRSTFITSIFLSLINLKTLLRSTTASYYFYSALPPRGQRLIQPLVVVFLAL